MKSCTKVTFLLDKISKYTHLRLKRHDKSRAVVMLLPSGLIQCTILYLNLDEGIILRVVFTVIPYKECDYMQVVLCLNSLCTCVCLVVCSHSEMERGNMYVGL